MSESKTKICMIPTCNKEVFTPKAIFCGEHDRDFRSYRKIAGMVASTTLLAGVRYVAKSVIGKKT